MTKKHSAYVCTLTFFLFQALPDFPVDNPPSLVIRPTRLPACRVREVHPDLPVNLELSGTQASRGYPDKMMNQAHQDPRDHPVLEGDPDPQDREALRESLCLPVHSISANSGRQGRQDLQDFPANPESPAPMGSRACPVPRVREVPTGCLGPIVDLEAWGRVGLLECLVKGESAPSTALLTAGSSLRTERVDEHNRFIVFE